MSEVLGQPVFLNPVLFATLSYHVERDFVPVATVSYVALALAVNAATPAKDMKELVAYIKAQKAPLGYARQPAAHHGRDVQEALGGQVLMTFQAFPTIQGHLRSGKLKVLAVSGDKRVPLVPDVPDSRKWTWGRGTRFSRPPPHRAWLRSSTRR